MASPRDIIGRGFAFPINVDAKGSMAWSVPLANDTTQNRLDALEDRMRQLLLTTVGERVLFKEYGTDIVTSILGLAQPALAASILRRFVDAIGRWEKRVVVVKHDVSVRPKEGMILFTLVWRSSSTGAMGMTVLPISTRFKEQS